MGAPSGPCVSQSRDAGSKRGEGHKTQPAISIHSSPHRISIASHTRIKATEKQEKNRNPKAGFQVRMKLSVAGWRLITILKDAAVYMRDQRYNREIVLLVFVLGIHVLSLVALRKERGVVDVENRIYHGISITLQIPRVVDQC